MWKRPGFIPASFNVIERRWKVINSQRVADLNRKIFAIMLFLPRKEINYLLLRTGRLFLFFSGGCWFLYGRVLDYNGGFYTGIFDDVNRVFAARVQMFSRGGIACDSKYCGQCVDSMFDYRFCNWKQRFKKAWESAFLPDMASEIQVYNARTARPIHMENA